MGNHEKDIEKYLSSSLLSQSPSCFYPNFNTFHLISCISSSQNIWTNVIKLIWPKLYSNSNALIFAIRQFLKVIPSLLKCHQPFPATWTKRAILFYAIIKYKIFVHFTSSILNKLKISTQIIICFSPADLKIFPAY